MVSNNKIDLEKKLAVDDSAIKNMSSLYKLKPYSVSAVINYFNFNS